MVQLLLRCSSARVATRRIYPATLKNQLSRASITPLTATPYRSRRVFSATSVLDRRVDILVPQLAESISEATLASLHKQLGEHVKTDEEVATLETDKIDVSANAPEDGRIVEVHVAENDTVTVGQKIATMDTDDGAGEPQKIEAESKESQSEALSTSPNAPQELPVEPSPEPKPEPSPSPASAPEAPAEVPVRPSDMAVPGPRVEEMPPSTQPTYRQERVERMPRIRQTIARRLKESQNRTASLTTVQRIDMSSLMQWRSQYKEHVMKEHGVRLGYMGAFTKAATMAALEIPQINASIDMDKEIITYRDYVDISIAVSTPKGLVTPVLRNTESMNVIDIERGVAALAGKARENKLTLDDLSGGNFSISNPGIFGSLFGTPLINYPQSTVFNINSIKEEPVVVDGQIVIRPLMFVTLTYDHRLIDGREAVGFLNKVKGYIEDPVSMLLFSRPMDE